MAIIEVKCSFCGKKNNMDENFRHPAGWIKGLAYYPPVFCNDICRSNLIEKQIEDSRIYYQKKIQSAESLQVKLETKKIQKKQKFLQTRYGESFYTSMEWLRLRFKFLKDREHICALCGSEQTPVHVDHIKPRSRYPELALDLNNLQILCKDCNLGKGNRDETDFRKPIGLTN